MTKIFFDTEFTGLHQKTTLISIGLVAETGETFYAEFTDYDESQVDEWIRENVISKLLLRKILPNGGVLKDKDKVRVLGNTELISQKLYEWFTQFHKVEMWSDCLAYDWVLFCSLFETALAIPLHIYYIPFDICTLFKIKGIDSDICREDFAFNGEITAYQSKHFALFDAQVIKKCYEKLMNL